MLDQYFGAESSAVIPANCAAGNSGRREKNLCRHGAHRNAGSLSTLPSRENVPVTFSGEIRWSSRLPQIPHRA